MAEDVGKSAGTAASAVEGELNAPIRWEGMEHVPFLHVGQIFVHGEDDHFELTFGQAVLPLEVGYSTETQARLVREGVPVTTVGRFVVTPAKMRDFIRVLTGVYAGWEKRQQDDKPEAPRTSAARRRRAAR